MDWRIGFLGLGLVSALVVGGVADQPPGPAALPRAPSELPPAHSTLPPAQSTLPPAQSTLPPGGEVPGYPPLPPKPSGLGGQTGSAGELIGFSGFDGSGSQTITLVHTGKMQIAVYHIDRSGQIRLVSSRPIDADFSLTLNPTDPLPGQIRLLSGQVK
ncbi:hypothetical protein NHH03_00410 [Stieleria sp. TO1_6]|uniref:hypothetical protein n=1 Tax=Stieleria tagensis TaxID=2956795 RepID=UPI00209A9F48|nr:hypothetical protein [Stieleria tagensis]MCO8120182.1 hypothetical protein [Stieleria tagensis]